MFDKELVSDSLQNIENALELIISRTSMIQTPNDFLCSPDGI